ncbi:hypothetical protein HYU93_05050 [Candidatus Daviesbacteria bacterium]|nr:hypothetical protein [Candidatus Daviesbacteria bacterium]
MQSLTPYFPQTIGSDRYKHTSGNPPTLEQLLARIQRELQEPYSYHYSIQKHLPLVEDRNPRDIAVVLELGGIGPRYDESTLSSRDLYDLSGLKDRWYWTRMVLTAPRQQAWKAGVGLVNNKFKPAFLSFHVGRLHSAPRGLILPATDPAMKTRIEQISKSLASAFSS